MIPYIQKVINEITESEPFERLFAIEHTAIVTGSASQYFGITVSQILEKALSSQTSSIVSVIEGMKKEGDDFQCYHTNPFGQTTPTVIEKRLSSKDESYNQALDDLLAKLKEKGMI